MLMMAIIAMIGAFTFGFVLCGVFAVSAWSSRSSAPSEQPMIRVSDFWRLPPVEKGFR
jgi:hypothetical protein